MSEWQPIETFSRLGVFEKPVLFAAFPGGLFPHGIYGIGTRIPTDDFTMMSGDYYSPTHWTPLPEPPVRVSGAAR